MRDLAASMGMSAPSLYNAFGDKQRLFARALELYLDCNARDLIHRRVLTASERSRPTVLCRDSRPLDQ